MITPLGKEQFSESRFAAILPRKYSSLCEVSRFKSFQPWTGAAAIAYHLRINSLSKIVWNLRWKPVCASTERELSKWLKIKPLIGNKPRAIVASRQTQGIGQRGRSWQSPFGGVWISAALPSSVVSCSSELLGLAVAVALAERLEKIYVPVRIKWPNDLMVGNKKLAGFLPRLIYRGENLQLARIGLGLNVSNNVPQEGIALGDICKSRQFCQAFWAAEALVAFERAIDLLGKEGLVCKEAERRLWATEVKDSITGKKFEIEGLNFDGALKLRNGADKTLWTRWA